MRLCQICNLLTRIFCLFQSKNETILLIGVEIRIHISKIEGYERCQDKTSGVPRKNCELKHAGYSMMAKNMDVLEIVWFQRRITKFLT